MTAIVRTILAAATVLLGACSTYNARWREAKAAPSADKFAGAYVGTWTSAQYKDAGGKLWCILTKKTEGAYLAQFRATWHGVFASEHEVMLKVTGREMREVPGSASLAISQAAIDALLFGTPPPPPPKARKTLVTNFTGAAEIHMWIGSGTYRCEGELWPATRRDRLPGEHALMIGRSWHFPSILPPRMTARYDATYDKGTLSLTKAAR